MALFEIYFHPALEADGYLTNKSKYTSSFNFCPCDQEIRMEKKSGGQVAGTNEAMAKILELLQQQNERLEDLEENGIPQIDEEKDLIGKINRVSEVIEKSPVFSGLFSDMRFGLRHYMKKYGVQFDTPPPHQQQGGQMNGTNNATYNMTAQEQMKHDLTILLPLWQEFPAILTKLARLAKEQPEDFEFYKRKLNEKINEL
jgi:hypothetical protein